MKKKIVYLFLIIIFLAVVFLGNVFFRVISQPPCTKDTDCSSNYCYLKVERTLVDSKEAVSGYVTCPLSGYDFCEAETYSITGYSFMDSWYPGRTEGSTLQMKVYGIKKVGVCSPYKFQPLKVAFVCEDNTCVQSKENEWINFLRNEFGYDVTAKGLSSWTEDEFLNYQVIVCHVESTTQVKPCNSAIYNKAHKLNKIGFVELADRGYHMQGYDFGYYVSYANSKSVATDGFKVIQINNPIFSSTYNWYESFDNWKGDVTPGICPDGCMFDKCSAKTPITGDSIDRENVTGRGYVADFHGVYNMRDYIYLIKCFDFSGYSEVKITFDTRTQNTLDYNDWMKLDVSTSISGYANVWTQKGPRTSWRTDTVDLTTYASSNTCIKFHIATMDSALLYLDNVHVTGKKSLVGNPTNNYEFMTYKWLTGETYNELVYYGPDVSDLSASANKLVEPVGTTASYALMVYVDNTTTQGRYIYLPFAASSTGGLLPTDHLNSQGVTVIKRAFDWVSGPVRESSNELWTPPADPYVSFEELFAQIWGFIKSLFGW